MGNVHRLGLGDTIGLPIAPSIRYGRVVAVTKAPEPTYLVREFMPHDGAWATGPVKLLPRAFVVPWRGGPV